MLQPPPASAELCFQTSPTAGSASCMSQRYVRGWCELVCRCAAPPLYHHLKQLVFALGTCIQHSVSLRVRLCWHYDAVWNPALIFALLRHARRQLDQLNARCRKQLGEYAYCAGPLAIGRGTHEQAMEALRLAAVRCSAQSNALEACKAQFTQSMTSP